MKTTKNSFTWKRGLCAAAACLLLGLTACNAATPTTLNAPGAAADGNAPATTQAVTPATTPATTQALVSTDTPEDLLTTEAPAPETEAPAPETAAPTPAETVNTDQCGENLRWSYNSENSRLTITGSGAMYDYAGAAETPWHEFCSDIGTVELPEGLTAIGKNAFADCTYLYTAEIPDGVTRIGEAAFLGCMSLNGVGYGGDRSSADYKDCSSLWIPDSVVEIGDLAFGYLNRNGEKREDFVLFGAENSAAARYAEENGLAFEPVKIDEARILEQLRADQTMPGAETRLSYYKAVGDRCLVKLVHVGPITLTENEIRDAKQNGVLTVNGKDYPFTDSWEDAGEMGFIQELTEQDPVPAGWIAVDTGAKQPFMTPILRRDDGRYVVRDYDHADMYWTDNSFTSLGWIWLGIENVNDDNNREVVQAHGWENFLRPFSKGVYDVLKLDNEGNVIISFHGGH